MKTFLVFVTLFLSGAWAYSSWYWYSCEIREVCMNSQKTQKDDIVTALQTVNTPKNIEENIEISPSEVEVLEKKWEENIREENPEEILSEVPSLSVDDVTAPSPVNSEPQTVTKEENIEKEAREIQDSNEDVRNTDGEQEEIGKITNSQDICSSPLVGPISIGANNDANEVAKLESFLLRRGDIVKADGIYGEDDFAAIEKFQETYRSEILTPWGINNPTGYVGRTTIQKIQALACN